MPELCHTQGFLRKSSSLFVKRALLIAALLTSSVFFLTLVILAAHFSKYISQTNSTNTSYHRPKVTFGSFFKVYNSNALNRLAERGGYIYAYVVFSGNGNYGFITNLGWVLAKSTPDTKFACRSSSTENTLILPNEYNKSEKFIRKKLRGDIKLAAVNLSVGKNQSFIKRMRSLMIFSCQ